MAKGTIHHFKSKKPSTGERIAFGKSLRKRVPIESLGIYTPPAKRKDPVGILEAQAKTRLPQLVPIRYARMLVSPYSFLRGAAAIMAADLAGSKSTGLLVQSCGDLHMSNFGVFASAERKLIFGINDFDETLPGPWEWDLKRLVASIVVGGRYLGADDDLCREAVEAAAKSYRKHMKSYASMGILDLWYSAMTDKQILKTLPPHQRKALAKITSKAKERTHMQVLEKLTDLVDDQYRIKVNAPFIVRETHSQKGRPIDEALGMVLDSYISSLADDRRYLLEQYRIVDIARKVVGVGSVGTRCWIIFMEGKSNQDPLFLQVKEAQPSVLEPFLSKTRYKNNGQRVVAGQRLIQGAPDIFLGWGELDGIHFYVRQMRDMKGGAEMDPNTVDFKNYKPYVRLCAWATALAHAKSGDAAAIHGYLGNSKELEKAMVAFAFSYATQTEKDHQALADAAARQRIKVAKSES